MKFPFASSLRPHRRHARETTRLAEQADRLEALVAAFSAALASAETTQAPPELHAALRWPHHRGEIVRLHADGKRITAVVGSEGADAGAIWQAITASAAASEGAGPARLELGALPEGLRAVAVRTDAGLVLWASSSVPTAERRVAAHRALTGGRGSRLAGLLPLPAALPGVRHWVAGAAAAGVAAAALVLAPYAHHALRPGGPGQVLPGRSQRHRSLRSSAAAWVPAGGAPAGASSARQAPGASGPAAGSSFPSPQASPSPQPSSQPPASQPSPSSQPPVRVSATVSAPLPVSVSASVGVSATPTPALSVSACASILFVTPCAGVGG